MTSHRKKRTRLKRRRLFLLLEVLIALFLVSLCVLPLLGPYVALFRSQSSFGDTIALDHAVSNFYADLIEQLHNNAIAWEALATKRHIPIEADKLKDFHGRPLPWKGEYWFDGDPPNGKHKPKKESPLSAYLFKLTFAFKPVLDDRFHHPLKYSYDVFVVRKLGDATKDGENGEKDKNDQTKNKPPAPNDNPKK